MTAVELERVYDDHAGGVFAFALSLTRVEDEAREVLQEVFVKLVRRDSVDSIADLRGYLLRIAHHCVIDRGRRELVRNRAAERLTREGRSVFASSIDADTEAFRQALSSAMEELPASQRAVVYLKLWEGRTFAEIAEVLDLPANTAASRYRYGLEKLRTVLQPLYSEIRHLPAP